MALHRLTRITIGVPNVEETAGYYAEFGLGQLPGRAAGEAASLADQATSAGTSPGGQADSAGDQGYSFTTGDGGEQMRLVPAARRRLVELRVGADDPDDIERVAAALARLDIAAMRTSGECARTTQVPR